MTLGQGAAWIACALSAAAATVPFAHRRIQSASADTLRVNVRGLKVPVVLGMAMLNGSLTGIMMLLALGTLGWGTGLADPHLVAAAALVIVVMGAAGEWDDRKGDERARGFAGHFGAARHGRLTGGVLKLVAGSLVGLAAGALTSSGRGIIETALLVALGANFVNLLDRGPGRAGKVTLLAGVPLVVFGAPGWALVAAGTFGGLAAVLPLDLAERAMLGDAGANPLGALVGLGLALSLGEAWQIAVIAVLLGGNLASERWSFSRAIERTPFLNAIDNLGRK